MSGNTIIDWQSFLTPSNLHLLPKKSQSDSHRAHHGAFSPEWENGAFIGNGITGAMIYQDLDRGMRWDLGRNDVVAHNFLEGIDWATPRVPIGSIYMSPAGAIEDETMKLELWDAEAAGSYNTTSGALRWRSISHAARDLILIHAMADDPADLPTFTVEPEHGISPRIRYAGLEPDLEALPPKPILTTKEGITVSIQGFITEDETGGFVPEGECAMAWTERQLSPNESLFLLSITNSRADDSAHEKAVAIVKEALVADIPVLFDSHRAWWHGYYPASMVQLPDPSWQAFYWQQIYKIGCATREDSVVLDSQGQWLTITPWPTTVWNLNVQLSYMSVYTANRSDLGMSLVRTLQRARESLRENAKPSGAKDSMFIGRATNPVDLSAPWPGTYELGNLTWALQNVWRHYRVTMDRDLLEQMLYPYLRESINLFLHLLEQDKNGVFHIPQSSSPEYPTLDGRKCTWYPIHDCNYSLALVRWGCKTLVEICGILGADDPLIQKWENVMGNLVPYPEDENGFRVGSEVPFAKSHRHFSHLLMIYPLHLVNYDQMENRELMKRSIDHWIGFEGALQGYSFTAASAMAASMEDGNTALKYLDSLKSFLMPNTMYAESGPVIETPLSAVESLHYMLLQSWGDTVRIFPAVPDGWHNVEFRNLLAEGGFEVSARRENGRTVRVEVTCKAGGTLKIKPNIEGTMKVVQSDGSQTEGDGTSLLEQPMHAGETVRFLCGN